jgi:4-oxalocrotonate tautomerase
MPIIDITLIEGRPAEKKAELIKEVTDATERALGCKRETVRVMIRDIAPENFGVAGVTKG